MKNLMIALVLFVGLSAHARGTEIGYSDLPIRSKAVFNAKEVTHFVIASASVGNEPAKIETTVDQDCMDRIQYAETSDYSQCQTTKTVEKRAVVKVTVNFDHVAPANEDETTDSVQLSIPQSSFTADQLVSIKAHNFGQSVQLKVQRFSSTEQVVDQDNSPSCTQEDSSLCQPLVYKDGAVSEVMVSVQAKL